ncbi:MAG: collagen-like protein [Ruminococcus sp.]|nr:collagen-like protein [Ruminococcus sp.]
MLTANQKYIDTANIKHLLSAGEKNADKIQIAVDRYYHQTDLSACLFTLRAVNSSGRLVMQNLEKETTENQIILTWAITEDFTAVPGQLLPEIVGQQDDTVVIKYEMTPMVVRNSILEQYKGGIDAIDKALREMQSILSQAEQLIAKMPIIKDGTWWLYDAATGDYVDSGYPAQGDKGDTGETGATGEKGDPGEPGTPGKDGADGYSPIATVAETDTGATITITDKNGTTTATVKNGASGESMIWGDYVQGCEDGESAKYCTATLVTVYGKQTWRILPSISTVTHNALDIVPDGLFVLDLSPDVDTLKESAHTHDNKEFLDGIETYLHSTYSKVTAEREAADNNLATRIKALEDNVGDISTVLAVMVEV